MKKAETAPAKPPARNFAAACWRVKVRVAEEAILVLELILELGDNAGCGRRRVMKFGFGWAESEERAGTHGGGKRAQIFAARAMLKKKWGIEMR